MITRMIHAGIGTNYPLALVALVALVVLVALSALALPTI
jgi:hypothetical protein